MKVIYLDVFLVALEYFMTLKVREVVYEWIIPAILVVVGVSVHYYAGSYVTTSFLNQFIAALINLFAILVGFTIATVAVFTTADKARNPFLSEMSTRSIGNTKVTWHRFIYINLIYAIISGIVMLALALGALLLVDKVELVRLAVFLILVFGTAHVLLLTTRNVTNLYYAFFELSK